jgi:hypothetical protein
MGDVQLFRGFTKAAEPGGNLKSLDRIQRR